MLEVKWVVGSVVEIVVDSVGSVVVAEMMVVVVEERIDSKPHPAWASLRVVGDALRARLRSGWFPILFRWRSFLPFYLLLDLWVEGGDLGGGQCRLGFGGGRRGVLHRRRL